MEAKGILSVGDSDVSDMPRRMRTKVLMVDDQPIIGEAIRHMLAAEEDVDFFFCEKPTEALSMAAKVNPTVILQDLVMPDVDGLIVGSPVRMMGIEVGHVTKIKPTNEEVFVKFILTDDSVKIPQGTVATVEFSGMAGSKSLELYLPDKTTYIEKNTPILTVEPPKRLHDALGLLNDMFDKLGAIIYTSSSFGEKLKHIDLQTGGNSGNVEEFLDYADKMVDDSNKRAEDFGKKLKKYEKKGAVNGKS